MNDSYQTVGQKVIDSLLEHYGFSPKQFSDKLGLRNPSQIYNYVNGVASRVTEKYADLIVSKFPELNRDYLLTGKGDMFTENDFRQQPDTSLKNASDIHAVLLHLVAIVNDQTISIAELTEQVKGLKLYIAAQQKQPFGLDPLSGIDEKK